LKKLYTVIILLVFFLCGLGYFMLDLLAYAAKPASNNTKEQVFNIKSGSNFNDVAEKLAAMGLISSTFKFKILAVLKGVDKKLQAGEYRLTAAMPTALILKTLVEGNVRLHRLTIPEGYSLKQVADAAETAGIISKDPFLKAAANSTLIAKAGLKADSFEGYLFPETYYFPTGVSAEYIILTMFSRFNSVITPAWRIRAQELGLSLHQIITLASIIEKESGDPAENPVISSVFHNRLKLKMKLQSDPTVIYSIKDYKGNIQKKHLLANTPYNTYRIKGLPPGPIANPGKKAIHAALFPDNTRLLFFVARKDGTHEFSSNIKDHNKAVRKYQLRKKR